MVLLFGLPGVPRLRRRLRRRAALLRSAGRDAAPVPHHPGRARRAADDRARAGLPGAPRARRRCWSASALARRRGSLALRLLAARAARRARPGSPASPRSSRRSTPAVAVPADHLGGRGADPAARRARRASRSSISRCSRAPRRCSFLVERGRRRARLPDGVVAAQEGRRPAAARAPLSDAGSRALARPLPRTPALLVREGRDDLPPRREPVVAAPAAARAGRDLRLQLLGAADRRRHARSPPAARHRRASATSASPPSSPPSVAVRFVFPIGEPRGPLVVDAPHRADPARAHLVEQVLDRLRAALGLRRGPDRRHQPPARRARRPDVRSSWRRCCLVVAAIVSLGLAFGAAYPRLDTQNAAQIATGFGGDRLHGDLPRLHLAVVALEAWPVSRLFWRSSAVLPFETRHAVLAGVLFAATAAVLVATFVIARRVGLRALRRLQV